MGEQHGRPEGSFNLVSPSHPGVCSDDDVGLAAELQALPWANPHERCLWCLLLVQHAWMSADGRVECVRACMRGASWKLGGGGGCKEEVSPAGVLWWGSRTARGTRMAMRSPTAMAQATASQLRRQPKTVW
jgi:hypothetical protein